MWSSKLRRTAAVLLLPALLAACGFQPLYGRSGTASAGLASVYVQPIEGALGQQVRNALLDHVGDSGVEKRYTLRTQVDKTVGSQQIARDATTTRAEVVLTATYQLLDADGSPVLNSTARSVAAYNLFDQQYAGTIAQRDAEERAARVMAQDIQTTIAAYFSRKKPQ